MGLFRLASQLPTNLPCSVSLQPGPDDKGKVKLLPLTHQLLSKMLRLHRALLFFSVLCVPVLRCGL